MSKQLNIELDSLVLHGRTPPDPRTLERQLAERLSETLAGGEGAPGQGGDAVEIARRIAASLPPEASGGGKR
jgi:hypothetical protein